jgi:hypothetical protein
MSMTDNEGWWRSIRDESLQMFRQEILNSLNMRRIVFESHDTTPPPDPEQVRFERETMVLKKVLEDVAAGKMEYSDVAEGVEELLRPREWMAMDRDLRMVMKWSVACERYEFAAWLRDALKARKAKAETAKKLKELGNNKKD